MLLLFLWQKKKHHFRFKQAVPGAACMAPAPTGTPCPRHPPRAASRPARPSFRRCCRRRRRPNGHLRGNVFARGAPSPPSRRSLTSGQVRDPGADVHRLFSRWVGGWVGARRWGAMAGSACMRAPSACMPNANCSVWSARASSGWPGPAARAGWSTAATNASARQTTSPSKTIK